MPSPVSRRCFDQLEHLSGLRDAQRSGRLVEDQELRVPERRPGDRDRLSLSSGQRVDRGVDAGDGRDSQPAELCRGVLLHVRLGKDVQEEQQDVAGRPARAEEQVRGGVEVVGERQVLVDGLDSERAGLARVRDVTGAPSMRSSPPSAP